MSKKVYTPPVEDCPECEELINTKCVVEEEALPGVGLSSGKTLSTILKRFSKRISKIYVDLRSAIFNVTPTYSTGLPIITYKSNPCDIDTKEINIPLFLNGNHCFEYDLDTTVTYTNEDVYHMFFNISHCSGVYVDTNDTVQITQVNGLVLTTPIIIKSPGATILTITDADKTSLLSEINTLTGSTFTDIITDTALSINGDLALGLYDPTGASTIFTTNLNFEFEVLDSLLVNKSTITETITTRNISGTGIATTTIVNFSVDSVGGVYRFFDELGVEITNQTIIDNLTLLIKTQQVRNICCADCMGGTPLDPQSLIYDDVIHISVDSGDLIAGDFIPSRGIDNSATESVVYIRQSLPLTAIELKEFQVFLKNDDPTRTTNIDLELFVNGVTTGFIASIPPLTNPFFTVIPGNINLSTLGGSTLSIQIVNADASNLIGAEIYITNIDII